MAFLTFPLLKGVTTDPPVAALPTRVSGLGTVRCDRQANIDMQMTLFLGWDAGSTWEQMSQEYMVFYEVPANTAKQLSAHYTCGEVLRNFGEWKAELYFKADNRSGIGWPEWGWTRWSSTQNLYNISC